MKHALTLLVALGLALPAAACGNVASTQHEVTMTIFAAASLSTVFPTIGNRFHQLHGNVTVRFDFAGTQTLVTQIENGAPADVFASADQVHMATLQSEGKVREAAVFARNRLVIIVPNGNPARIAQPFDLSRPGVKLDLAAITVPAGKSAHSMLAKLGSQPGAPAGFEAAALKNVVSNEDNVEAVVTRVALGEADAGVVYASDLKTPNGARVASLAIPDAANVINVYPIAVVFGSDHPTEAQAFADFVRGPAGQQLLEMDGFLPE
ncbi:MAG TPA: molybdate ABC transporter substrate-binding protein [Candidatus Dormibacteraeota bacterium]|jgi:molybdate transport system substrate-binding protein